MVHSLAPRPPPHSGPAGLSASLTPTYTNNVNVGTATASAAYGGDANHDGSLGSDTFEITPAPSTTTVDCPVSEEDPKTAVEGKSADLGGARILKKKKTPTLHSKWTFAAATAHAASAR